MEQQSSDTRIFVQDKSITTKHSPYFLLLISPVTWFKCFSLVFYRTQARTRSIAILQYFVLLLTVLLMTVSCYLSYTLADDGGQYNLYLSNVASNITSMNEGRNLFNKLIWRTVLKTFFLSIVFGLIQACNYFLAAQWRQRLCDRFYELSFRSPNGCVLYDMVQTKDNIYKVFINDIKQFTSSFASVLFGCLFFKSIISMFALIITACVFIVRTTDGDLSGILICFMAFIFCILITLPGAHLYNSNLVTQSKRKGHLRSYIQRIQTYAQCIVLYGSQRVEFKYIQQLLSAVFVITGLCTYTIPSVIFFYIRKTQSPELARNLLNVVGSPLLQSEVNLEARRGQCVLISGPSGCGKTSLFLICAGLRSIDAKQIILPARHHLLFIPQRSYLPHGSLRFQALFLIHDQSTINDKDLFQLFRSVNLLYLLERYALDTTIIAWLLSLIMAGISTWSFYIFVDRTAALYNGLSGYASGSITLDEAKQSIKSDIVSYILIIITIPITYSLSVGGGRALASLYTRRQLNYLSRLLLDAFEIDNANNLLYYSRHMSMIPNFISHEIAELNTEVFNILFGQAHGLSSITDDSYAQQLLNEFNLGHLIDRYSMDGKKHIWSELLSIGEQQRLMMVTAFLVGTETIRLFILDETTSACDKQMEKAIYEHLQRLNVQFISISHQRNLRKYHSQQMTIDTRHMSIPIPVLKTRF
ncbi:unnamed protein product [Rotaria sordida]|uniref:AAA+ ATPase domain-containing protein n=1 Tax=Rotaria sordida TaxID=392033 RepID=A0A819X5L6_9BILA|nr:unnamed protein product [Rotaria sordida]CAF4134251.1 unnamed protein product [Rotaria sordida]